MEKRMNMRAMALALVAMAGAGMSYGAIAAAPARPALSRVRGPSSPWGRLYPAQGKGHGRTGNQLRARRAKRRRRVRSRRTARRGTNR